LPAARPSTSGDTKNSSPDPTIGYGTFHDNNNTYNINAGATVKGDNFGLVLGSGGTINNSGAVTGDVGIDGTDFFTVNNISTSTSVAVISGADVGISAGELILNNTGTVEATRPSGDGISARSVDVTANSGTIRGGGHGHPIVFYRHREQFPLRPHLGQGIRHQRRNRHRHRQCRHDRSNGNGR